MTFALASRFHIHLLWVMCLNRFLNVKVLVGAFSMMVKLQTSRTFISSSIIYLHFPGHESYLIWSPRENRPRCLPPISLPDTATGQLGDTLILWQNNPPVSLLSGVCHAWGSCTEFSMPNSVFMICRLSLNEGLLIRKASTREDSLDVIKSVN